MTENNKFKPGHRNLITDVPGLFVGNASDLEVRTGVTVIRCEHPMTAAVDVRGGGPGTREIDLLSAENFVQEIDAIVLSGGSVFGLASADGVVNDLSQQAVGLKMIDTAPSIPIVPAAVLFDFGGGGNSAWGESPPYFKLGREALADTSSDFSLGAAGAGTGATCGLVQGGIGSTSIDLGDGVIVGALAAVNSVGSSLMPDGESFYAWEYELAGELGGVSPPPKFDLSDPFPDEARLRLEDRLQTGANTTLAVVATTVNLTVGELKRVAIMAHDGFARAIRPVHAPFDGDVVFSLSNGQIEGPKDDNLARALLVARIGSAAADCMARAIARGVFQAQGSDPA